MNCEQQETPHKPCTTQNTFISGAGLLRRQLKLTGNAIYLFIMIKNSKAIEQVNRIAKLPKDCVKSGLQIPAPAQIFEML